MKSANSATSSKSNESKVELEEIHRKVDEVTDEVGIFNSCLHFNLALDSSYA